jgi:hypothetical protein
VDVVERLTEDPFLLGIVPDEGTIGRRIGWLDRTEVALISELDCPDYRASTNIQYVLAVCYRGKVEPSAEQDIQRSVLKVATVLFCLYMHCS